MNQENENVRGFIKYVLKTLRHVAFAAFKSTMAVASPLILLVSVWYQSVEVGAYLFVSMLAVWVVLTGIVTIKAVKAVPDTGMREAGIDWGCVAYVLKSAVRVAAKILAAVIPAALLTAAWHLRGDEGTSFILLVFGFWALLVGIGVARNL